MVCPLLVSATPTFTISTLLMLSPNSPHVAKREAVAKKNEPFSPETKFGVESIRLCDKRAYEQEQKKCVNFKSIKEVLTSQSREDDKLTFKNIKSRTKKLFSHFLLGRKLVRSRTSCPRKVRTWKLYASKPTRTCRGGEGWSKRGSFLPFWSFKTLSVFGCGWRVWGWS